MKEEEARKKWCPMARFHVIEAEVEESNRQGFGNGMGYKNNHCITSDCMMWVEDKSTNAHTGVSSVCGGHCGLITP